MKSFSHCFYLVSSMGGLHSIVRIIEVLLIVMTDSSKGCL
nr:MAG TPA: hypothetical protein [Caudoviricetes sp.]